MDKLFILWTSRDPEVAKNMVFMYAKNAKLKGWWGTVRVIVWGPSAELLVNDAGLQAELADTRKAGVEVQACKACADRYGVSARLEALDVEVLYIGATLTEYIKSGWASLSV